MCTLFDVTTKRLVEREMHRVCNAYHASGGWSGRTVYKRPIKMIHAE